MKLCLVESATEELAIVEWRGERTELENSHILEKVTAIMKSLGANEILAEEITVTIKGPHLPNFEFVDLPGIREFGPQDDEVATAAAKASHDLTNAYLDDPQTLILVVVPATMPSLNSNQGIAAVIRKKKTAQVCS